jgi:hypothetical protein
MSEAVYQPRFVEEDVFSTGDTPYDEFATFEIAGDAYGDDDPSRLTQLFQAYGRKAGALVLAGTALVGLDACSGPAGQTTDLGGPRPVKVLGVNGGQLETGNCILQKQAGNAGDGHNCSPQASQLKSQTVAQVRKASNQGLFGGTDTLTVQASDTSCDGPGAKFIRDKGVGAGSVIEKLQKSFVDLKQTPNVNKQYCEWKKL